MSVASFISQNIFLIHFCYIREKYELNCKLISLEHYLYLIVRMAQPKNCPNLVQTNVEVYLLWYFHITEKMTASKLVLFCVSEKEISSQNSISRGKKKVFDFILNIYFIFYISKCWTDVFFRLEIYFKIL